MLGYVFFGYAKKT